MRTPHYPLMHNTGLAVEDLDAASHFFTDLGLTLEGRVSEALPITLSIDRNGVRVLCWSKTKAISPGAVPIVHSTSTTIMPRNNDEWPFDEPRNVACFTTHAVLGGAPILEVYHDYDDGAWQFHAADTGEPALVALEEIYKRDPSIGELNDLECGWRAIRGNLGESWNRSLNHPYPTYEKHGYYLDNAAQLAKIFPDTFSIPPEDERLGIKEGDFVKLMFSFIPEGQEPNDYDCERMWVIAKEDCDGHWKGILDNDPLFHETVSTGAELCFHPDHIMAIERLTKA